MQRGEALVAVRDAAVYFGEARELVQGGGHVHGVHRVQVAADLNLIIIMMITIYIEREIDIS